MSTLQNNQASWTTLTGHQLDSKYEKCRNITEEIYKRINITFQIKKLETGDQSDISDNSDQIDSNELSNETDLFACDKSDISSSTEADRPPGPPVPLNNNNEEKSKTVVYKRPRKRFRKRVKKRPPNRQRSDSEGSSDEAPLSRSLILSPDLKPKLPAEKTPSKKSSFASNNLTLRELLKPTNIKVPTVLLEKIKSIDSDAVKKSDTTDKKIETTDDKTIDSNVIDNKAKNIDMFIDNKIEKAMTTDKKIDLIKDYRVETRDVEVGKDKKGTVLSIEDEKKKVSKDVKVTDWKSCSLCSLSFRGERGLRRHISMSHIASAEGNK